jgi:hypothetical protein
MQLFFTALVQLTLLSGLAAGVTKHVAFPTRPFPPSTTPKPIPTSTPYKKKFRPSLGQLTVGYALLIDGVTTGFLLSVGVVVLGAAGVGLRNHRRLALALVPFTAQVRRRMIRRRPSPRAVGPRTIPGRVR